MDQNTKKQKVAEAVLDYISNGESLGIGSGSTVNILIENLSKVKNKIRNVVSSSVKSTELLKRMDLRFLNYVMLVDLQNTLMARMKSTMNFK